MSHECIIGIGSNINAEQNFTAALSFLRQEHELIAVSSKVLTTPIGITDQPDFLNGAAKVSTTMDKDDFKNYLKGIEDRLKRDRNSPRFGSRTIDLDIVVWDGSIIDSDYYSRDFLKVVVDEII